MAKILMESGEPPVEMTTGGSTFYVMGGRAFVRQRVTPIQPRTAAQRREVNAITNASRAWAWRMTPADHASWGFPCSWGFLGSPWAQAIWSIFEWIFHDWPGLDFSGICPDPICATAVDVDVVAGSMSVTIAAGGTATMLGYVAASPPMSPGRVPVLDDTRSLVVGISAGTVVDVGAAYVERFGRLPVSGFVGVAVRFADAADASATPICFTVWPIGGAPTGLVSANPNPQNVFVAFGMVTPFSWNVSASFFDGTTTWMLTITLPGVTGSPLGPFNINSTDVVNGGLSVLTAGVRSGVFRATSVQTGAIAELAVSVTVIVFTFP